MKNSRLYKVGIEYIEPLKGYISKDEERARILYDNPDNKNKKRYYERDNETEIGLQVIDELNRISVADPVIYVEAPQNTTIQRDLKQERRNAVNQARKQQRTVKSVPNVNPQTKMEYINKPKIGLGQNTYIVQPKVQEEFTIGKRENKPSAFRKQKNYDEIAEMFYPNMEVKSEITPLRNEIMLPKTETGMYLESQIPTISDAEKLLYPNGTLGEMTPKKLYDLTKSDEQYENGESINRLDENTNLIMPVKNYRISSSYGNRVHPTLKEIKFHDGIDLAVPIGTEVKAAADGKVTRVLVNGGYGKYIELEHKNGLKTFYAHLSEWTVKVGAIVNKGQVIALSGNSAGIGKNGQIMTTGPHLHFGAKKNGKTVNPLDFIKE